ncbi:MAG: nodulation protein NfeD [Elusimicrobia bacterium]|nr:nodulation protein NfeD [Elusimicrobiota bacterium]
MAADVAAMAPQTHLGAATPVTLGGMPFSPGTKDESKDKKGRGGVLEEKALSDTAAYARTLATTKGRNAAWAERAVRESLSLTSEEALRNRVIDLVAADEADLLKKLSGKEVKKGALTFNLNLEGARRVDFPMSPLRKWLHTIANPNVAYLLLVLGFYALVYEFSTPGIGLGAIAGIICLVLAFFSLQVLPLNFAGLVLLVAGLIMMGLDILVGSHGLLIFGGLISFAIGSFFLFDVNQAVFRVSMELILAIVLTSAGFFGFVIRKIWSARRSIPVTGAEGLVGQMAEVRPEGMVFVDGALWTVEGDLAGCVLGEKVRVVKISGNRLVVQKEA